MCPRCLLLLAMSLCFNAAGTLRGVGQTKGDSLSAPLYANNSPFREVHRTRLPLFLNLKYAAGAVLPTHRFLERSGKFDYAQTATLKFGFNAAGDTWQDVAYGMPYVGIGVDFTDFGRRGDIGAPLGIYLLQGATISRISPRLSLNYEFNLGGIYFSQPYHIENNPENLCIGSRLNVYLMLNLYLRARVSENLDLNFGVDFSHVSNGSVKLPNSGINTLKAFVELSYNFNRAEAEKRHDPTLSPPRYKGRFVSDISVHAATRQRTFSTWETGLPSKYVPRNFKVMGLSYALMRVPRYRARYGVGVDAVFDDSSGAKVWAGEDLHTGEVVPMIRKAGAWDRFSVGVSLRGELSQPGFSIFAQAGVTAVNADANDNKFYQAIGAKVYVVQDLYLGFSIRCKDFSRARYLFWSLGYTIGHGRHKVKSSK